MTARPHSITRRQAIKAIARLQRRRDHRHPGRQFRAGAVRDVGRFAAELRRFDCSPGPIHMDGLELPFERVEVNTPEAGD